MNYRDIYMDEEPEWTHCNGAILEMAMAQILLTKEGRKTESKDGPGERRQATGDMRETKGKRIKLKTPIEKTEILGSIAIYIVADESNVMERLPTSALIADLKTGPLCLLLV